MRDNSVLRSLLGLCVSTVVVVGRELVEAGDERRSKLVVWVRRRARARGRCGRCGVVSPWFDNGGGERRWRHVDMGMATCELVAEAPRVSCPEHGVTVAQVSFARHDSAFTRAFEDLVVFDAIVSNKLAAARRHGISWRAVDHMCIRVATEALGRVDLLEGLVAIAIDEVKYKKGHKYLTVVCDHLTGRVIWAAKGRTKETVRAFFDALGDERAGQLQFVTCDGAEWIRSVIAERAPEAVVCLDTFHLIGWATDRPRRGPERGVEHAPAKRRGEGGQGVQGPAVDAAAQLGEPFLQAEGHHPRSRAGQQAGVPGLAAEGRAARRHGHATAGGTSGPRQLAGLRIAIQARSVREAGPDHPELPGLHRSHARMEAHQRDLRVEQRRHRPDPLGGPGLPRSRELHHHDHARPSRHRPSTAVGGRS